MTSFDRETAHHFITKYGNPFDRLRLSHWYEQAGDEAVWQALGPSQ